MTALLFFTLGQLIFVATLMTCDCDKKVVETLLVQCRNDDDKFTN